MYRQYEDYNTIEKRLDMAKQDLFMAMYYNDDDDHIAELRNDLHELEERLNFAMQDMESEMDA